MTLGSGQLTLHADTSLANVNWLINTCSKYGIPAPRTSFLRYLLSVYAGLDIIPS